MTQQAPIAADVAAAPQPAAFLAERECLVSALDFIVRIVERRNTIPTLSNVLIEPCERGARFTGTDLDMEIAVEIDAAWGAPGAFTVPAETLRDVLRKVPKDSQVSVAYDPESGRVTIAAGRVRSTLPTLPADDFPRIAFGDLTAAFTMPARDALRDFAALSPAMSREETRYYLNGVAFQLLGNVGPPSLVMVATDGGQLVRIARPAPAGADALVNTILPRKPVAEIVRKLKRKGGDAGELEFQFVGDSRIRIMGPGWVMTSKAIDGTFPSWQDAIATALGTVELQGVAMIELHARLDAVQIGKLSDAAGVALAAETGESAALLRAPDYPEYLGLSMFMREGEGPKGFSFNEYSHARDHAERYAAMLAAASGLPAFDHICPHWEGGLIRGVTFGKAVYIKPEPVERICYDTLTATIEEQEPYFSYQDGAYCIPLPRSHGALVSAEIDGDEAGLQPVRTNAKGEIALSAAAVAFMAGDVADMPRVDIPRLQFLHGEIVAGMFFPPVPTVATGKTSGRRTRPMTDREAILAYCADPVGFTDSLRARPVSEIADQAEEPQPFTAKRDICPGPMYKGEPWKDVFANVARDAGDTHRFDNTDGVISIVNLWKRKGGLQRTRIPARLQEEAMRLWEGQAERYAAKLAQIAAGEAEIVPGEPATPGQIDATERRLAERAELHGAMSATAMCARMIANLVQPPAEPEDEPLGDEGQDRESYSDDQDRESYTVDEDEPDADDGEAAALRAEIAALKATVAALESKLTDALYVALRQMDATAAEPQPVAEPVVIEATFEAYGRSYSTPVLAGFTVGADQAERIAELEAEHAAMAESLSARDAAVERAHAELAQVRDQLAASQAEAQQNAERALTAEIALGRMRQRMERFGPLLDAAEQLRPMPPLPADIADYRIPAAV